MKRDRLLQHITHGEQGSVRDFSLALRGLVGQSLDSAENLADIPDKERARDNLGLGVLAQRSAVTADIIDAGDVGNINRRLGTFSTVADVENSHIPPVLDSIRTKGYYSPGDGGGALYVVGDEGPGAIQSGDGRWWELADQTLNVLMFGAVGDGVADDTDAIKQAVSYPRPVSSRGEYKFLVSDFVDFSCPRIHGELRLIQAFNTTWEPAFTFSENVAIDTLVVEVPNGFSSNRCVEVGSNGFSADKIHVYASQPQLSDGSFAHGAVILSGQNISVSDVMVQNFDRAINIRGSSIHVETMTVRKYIRGVWMSDGSSDISFSKIDVSGHSESGSTALNSGVLIEGATRVTGNSITVSNSTTHAIRFGSDGAENVNIQSISTFQAGGCGLKLRPAPDMVAKNIYIDSLLCVDSGTRNIESPTVNDEGILLELCENVYIGRAVVRKDQNPTSGHSGLRIRSANNVEIASLSISDTNREGVWLHSEQSLGEGQTRFDDITNVTIKSLSMTNPGRHAVWLEIDTAKMENINILGPAVFKGVSPQYQDIRLTINNGGQLSGQNNWQVYSDRPGSGIPAVSSNDVFNDSVLLEMTTGGSPLAEIRPRSGSTWWRLGNGRRYIRNEEGAWEQLT